MSLIFISRIIGVSVMQRSSTHQSLFPACELSKIENSSKTGSDDYIALLYPVINWTITSCPVFVIILILILYANVF